MSITKNISDVFSKNIRDILHEVELWPGRALHGAKSLAQIQPAPLQENQTRPETVSLDIYSPYPTHYPFTCTGLYFDQV